MQRILTFAASAAGLVFTLGSGHAATQGVGSLPSRIIVHFKPNAQLARSASADPPALPRARIAALGRRLGADLRYVGPTAGGGHIVQPRPSPAPIAETIARLRRDPNIALAEEDRPVRYAAQPNDVYYPVQWNLQPATGASYGADFEHAWKAIRGNARVIVAVIDTGVLPHPDLVDDPRTIDPPSGALAASGYDFISDCRIRGACPPSTADEFSAVAPSPGALDRGDWVSEGDRGTPFFAHCAARDSSWHGTYVSGIVAALTNNGGGVAGGAFGAKILPVRVLGKCGGYISDVAEAIRWAAGTHPVIKNPQPARVVNLSLAAEGPCSRTLQAAIDSAVAGGALVVAAAGNAGTEASLSMLPSCNNVFAVAASTRAGDIAFYSNRSRTHIELSAPGGEMSGNAADGIVSLSNAASRAHDPTSWNYVYNQGTSSAAPHVSAAAALLLSIDPAQAPARLAARLTHPHSVTPFPVGSECAALGHCGAGILNVKKLIGP